VQQLLQLAGQHVLLGASFEHFVASWGYVGIFVLAFISAMGLPVGAEVAFVFGGVLASGQVDPSDRLNFVAVIVVALVGELLGCVAGYAIGMYGGRPLVDKAGKYVLLSHKDLDRAEAWFAKRGEPVALFGRFIPLLRSFVSFACGLGEMALGKFLLFSAIGCALWITALVSLGYSLGASYEHVLHTFSSVGYVLGALFVVAVVVGLILRWREYRAQSTEKASEPGT
jgi:membrane protein DedA with SNARE-associated domain